MMHRALFCGCALALSHHNTQVQAVPAPPSSKHAARHHPDTRSSCGYLLPNASRSATYNGSMLEHASLVLPLTLGLWAEPRSAGHGAALGGNFTTMLFDGEPCRVTDASCDLDIQGSYWNTNFSLTLPPGSRNSTDSTGPVRVRGNYLPCPSGSGFRLKAILHLNSFGKSHHSAWVDTTDRACTRYAPGMCRLTCAAAMV
jgi:hypothetical protein